MDDELDLVTGSDSDLQKAAGLIWSDHHRDLVFVEVDPPDRVAVGMEDVFVSDAVAAGAVDDHWIHGYQVSLTTRSQATAMDTTRFANGLLTEFPGTSRFWPSPADTTIRETPAQTPFPATRHHRKTLRRDLGPGVERRVQVLSPAQHCKQGSRGNVVLAGSAAVTVRAVVNGLLTDLAVLAGS